MCTFSMGKSIPPWFAILNHRGLGIFPPVLVITDALLAIAHEPECLQKRVEVHHYAVSSADMHLGMRQQQPPPPISRHPPRLTHVLRIKPYMTRFIIAFCHG